MARLYAEITSDKGGRVVGKGGDHGIMIRIMHGSRNVYNLTVENDQVIIYKNDGPLLHDWVSKE